MSLLKEIMKGWHEESIAEEMHNIFEARTRSPVAFTFLSLLYNINGVSGFQNEHDRIVDFVETNCPEAEPETALQILKDKGAILDFYIMPIEHKSKVNCYLEIRVDLPNNLIVNYSFNLYLD